MLLTGVSFGRACTVSYSKAFRIEGIREHMTVFTYEYFCSSCDIKWTRAFEALSGGHEEFYLV
jgi:hypothetical protein